MIGGEFLADFSPGLGTFNNVLFEQSPNVNSYMFNADCGGAIRTRPQLRPIHLRRHRLGDDELHHLHGRPDSWLRTSARSRTETVSGSRFGWDLGGGVMAWSEKNWGFRGDVRYYRTTSNTNDVLDLNNIGDGSVFSRVELSGISFWKANAGLSFRW